MDNILYLIVIYPIIFILPAYVANGAPVIFGGGTPLDFNRKCRGRSIFGKHKTVRGLASGIASGVMVGFAMSLFPGFGFMLGVGILESFGTHFGDLLGSFIKRQRGVQEGKRSLFMDQYLFLVFAIAFAAPLALPQGLMPGISGIAFLVVLTGIMHPLTNIGAYLLKLKKVPW
ncbi:MAG: CDP-2,3-bis-(O-geranylgeranyl)-sn-glycerol synthase [Candidatus Marsarchaeota archaeon]|nr:CDP-2,3-bis-(O-geranylgeranyl)-sn-glycerol synthase [Candidatus Marsarchaeota archaeon]MCL5413205.1 CDP-2,3-bis-(O-geranylgeranyl)-sn-glycerol synthase [Candidatus Marsarchaeota archaeon]